MIKGRTGNSPVFFDPDGIGKSHIYEMYLKQNAKFR